MRQRAAPWQAAPVALPRGAAPLSLLALLALLSLLGLLALLGAATPAGASVAVACADGTHTGASFFATADASDPDAVVLVEWDFDGDGRADVNRTDSLSAGYTYMQTGDFDVRVSVTRQTTQGLEVENATKTVHVADGSPQVQLVVTERKVAGVEETFRANAHDPDASSGGEAFAYAWFVDGEPVPGVGAEVTVLVDQPGEHNITVTVTDEEGLTASTTQWVEFAPPGLLEGRQGVINLGLLVAAASLGVGLGFVRLAQRDRRRAKARTAGSAASAAAEGPVSTGRPAKPEKVPFEAAAEVEAGAGGARIVVGGAPAATLRTKECPVCHNAIDADVDPADCPYCKANAEAEELEATLAGPTFEDVDLSEVRALLQRARRERHLGRTDVHSQLISQARDRAEELVGERDAAGVWLEKARRAVEHATARTDPERLDRAHSYLKLAESLSKAHQHGKVRRHAQRCVELLTEGAAGPDTPDRCHACGGAIAAARAAGAQRCPHCDVALLPDETDDASKAGEQEEEVRGELHAVRTLLTSGEAAPDEEAWALLREAEAFEREAAWGQALELLRALRERFERERQAAGGGDEGAGDPDE